MAKWTGLGDNTELFWAVLSQSSPDDATAAHADGVELPDGRAHPRAAAWSAELASSEPPLHPLPRHAGCEGPTERTLMSPRGGGE
jgi:hypothetical protein